MICYCYGKELNSVEKCGYKRFLGGVHKCKNPFEGINWVMEFIRKVDMDLEKEFKDKPRVTILASDNLLPVGEEDSDEESNVHDDDTGDEESEKRLVVDTDVGPRNEN